MINKVVLNDYLVKYKEEFANRWKDEKYKWEAVKCFQDNWNEQDSDFASMLKRSFAKTDNLLASSNFFPLRMITGLADRDPDLVRSMFLELFDESKDVFGRIERFKNDSKEAMTKLWDGNINNYQVENSISTYLWLRYPNKYYIYKYGEVKEITEKLNTNYSIKKGLFKDNLDNFFNLYNEINSFIQKDKELLKMFKNSLTDACYSDQSFNTLTIDFCFFISRKERNDKIDNNSRDESIEPAAKENSFEIYYGIPGCGKSFIVDKKLRDDGYKTDYIVRTVFHPDYTNSDFIGQYMPEKYNNNMRFVVKAGPFTRALAKALNNPHEKVALVIEEINRGNASAIFGEIFQLLDMDKNTMKSRYTIFNPIISDYLKEKCSNKSAHLDNVYIPSNLSIICTMNTSDQNVFKFDTAFKRRWEMHRVVNDRESAIIENSFIVPNLEKEIMWLDFVDKINATILDNDLEEDRQLGYWFFNKANDDITPKSFGEKVLEYLWNDVTKHDHSILFLDTIKSFDQLLTDYLNKKQVFKFDF